MQYKILLLIVAYGVLLCVFVQILAQGENTGVIYEYALVKSPEDLLMRKTHTYRWSVSVSACSEPCASGKQTSLTQQCQRNNTVCFIKCLWKGFAQNCYLINLLETQPKLDNHHPCPFVLFPFV